MTAASIPMTSPAHKGGVLIFIALVMLAAIGTAVGMTYTHGDTKHGSDAQKTRQCLDNNGALQSWYNSNTNRCAYVALLAGTEEEGRFGIQVVNQADEEEVTAFAKNKMTRLDQVVQYLKNAGYLPQE
jgi:hypothetical protein